MFIKEGVSELAAVFVANHAQLRRAAIGVVGNIEWAEDVVQDAYLKLIAAQTALVVDNPLGYCFQVVRNMARDHRRRTALETDLLALEEEGEHVPSTQRTPEQLAISRQNIVILEKALMKMPERTRRAFEMYFVKDMTQRDICHALGVSLGLVNGMLKEAGDVLRQCQSLLARE